MLLKFMKLKKIQNNKKKWLSIEGEKALKNLYNNSFV